MGPAQRPVTVEAIARSPAWFPLEPAGGKMRLVALDESAYRAASFLDQRLLKSGYPEQTCTLALLESAAAQLRPPAHYIFHTGHVGSTLISRLLGEYPELFTLREPALLRSLCGPGPIPAGTPGLAVTLALLGRTWRDEQRALIKVTSFVSELAGQVLAAKERPTAIFVFAQPLAYLSGILAGPNSRIENRQLAPARLQRLARRLGEGHLSLEPRSEGEAIAMSWLCEMSALEQAAAQHASGVLWVNFDAFLAQPMGGLQDIFRALGAAPAAQEIQALVNGPLMSQYSKAPQHAYDAALRRAVLQSGQRDHAQEVARGMAWLEALASRHALIDAVLARAAPARQLR